MNIMRTLIVPAGIANAAKQIARECDAQGEGMFVSALSPTGNLPATHYVSSGYMDEQFGVALENAINLHSAAVAGAAKQGRPQLSTQQDATNVLTNGVVHAGFNDLGEPETPHELFARLGLKLITESA